MNTTALKLRFLEMDELVALEVLELLADAKYNAQALPRPIATIHNPFDGLSKREFI